MATAVCLKSESGDFYLFAMDKEDLIDMNSFCDGMRKEWYISEEYLYVEALYTDEFDYSSLSEKITGILEECAHQIINKYGDFLNGLLPSYKDRWSVKHK